MHSLRDRKFHGERERAFSDGADRERSFGDLTDLKFRFIEGEAPAEREPKAEVARLRAVAGEDEIPHSREPGERQRMGSERFAEAHDFRKSAGYQERTVLITDKEKGLLNRIAEKEGYPVLNLPDGIGGRFSVLTPVGLFPSALMGLDIKRLSAGAAGMAAHTVRYDGEENMAFVLAAILYLMDKAGKKIHVVMPYCERLAGFADWFRQLEAESLGKKGLGPTPTRSMGVTDQHSQLQLYVEGPKDKCVILFYSATQEVPIPASFDYLEDVQYLANKDMRSLFHAEFQGTRLSLTEAQTPNISLVLDEVSDYNLGALFYLFEMVTAIMGHLLGVNAFDQPGVEQGKIYTKAMMGKKGLEKEKEHTEALLLRRAKTIVF